MPRRAARELTARGVLSAGVGRSADRATTGLYLLVRPAKSPDRQGELDRFWLFRYTHEGRLREMGLGPAAGPDAVPLADQKDRDGKIIEGARTKARRLRAQLRDGADPLAAREIEAARKKAEAAHAVVAAITFQQVAEAYIAAHEAGWRSGKHASQWAATLAAYAYPVIGALPVADVNTGHLARILEPMWKEKTETASRVRGRIESVLDYATAREWRTGDNPARWRGHLANLLPRASKVARVEHHAALPWREVGSFVEALAGQGGVAALALRFAILTAARSGEVRGCTWGELDIATATWTVPGARMKAGREHRVPLSDAALAVLREAAPLRDQKAASAALVFPGAKAGKPLSDMSLSAVLRRMKRADLTVHGFRSTFRDWCAEATGYPRELAEAALAHVLRDKTEAAYQRGDLFDKRARLMAEWATFCRRVAPAGGDVVPLRKPEAA